MSCGPDDPATRRAPMVVYLRLNEYHASIVKALIELAGIEPTEAVRRMIDHWQTTQGDDARRPPQRLGQHAQKRAC